MDEAEVIEPAPEPVVAPREDRINDVLSWMGLAIAVLSLAEILATMTIGLAVKVKAMNFPIRQGYAFLTILEKSPVGLALIIAAVFAAIASARRKSDELPMLTKVSLVIIVVAGAILAVATILGVMARFKVGELRTDQQVDSITRRVLVVFVIRNFGAAVVSLLLAIPALGRGWRDA